MDDNGALRRTAVTLRERVVLEVVDPHEARGFLIPGNRSRSVPYRGPDGTDYACGGCGYLLAIGVRRRMFQGFLFACACGALNQVP